VGLRSWQRNDLDLIRELVAMIEHLAAMGDG
jgi:hypothetical protein